MTDDKKSSGNRRYAIISGESIQSYGEATGHTNLSEDVTSMLAEDVMYRVREMVQHSCQFMRHARRKKLTSEDLNKAMRNADVQPVFGYGSSDAMSFRQTKEGEIFFVEDSDVNLANIGLGTHIPHQIGKTSVKAHWLAVEGLPKSYTSPNNPQGKPSKSLPNLNEQQRQYVESVSKAILGTDKELTKLAMNDLHTNPNISPMLPYLLHFISYATKNANNDLVQLNKILQTIRALVNNPSLFLQPKSYMKILVESVMLCVVDPLESSNNKRGDHWSIREFAARLLVQISRDCPDPSLEQKNLDQLQEVIYDLTKPLSSHYGAIIALCSFGTQAVEEILRPHLPTYMLHIETLMSSGDKTTKENANKVYGGIRLCCEYVIRAWTQKLLKLQQETNSGDLQDNIKSFVLPRSPRVPNKPVNLQPQVTPTLDQKPTLNGAVESSQSSVLDSQASTLLLDSSQTSSALLGSSQMSVDLMDSSQIKSSSQETNDTMPVLSKETTVDDLVGTVIQLPESNNPYKIAAELYREFSLYFGDSLSARLPVQYVPGFYIPVSKDDFIVELYGEESKKSGDELLKQIMNTHQPGVSRRTSGSGSLYRHPGHHAHRMLSFASGEDGEIRYDFHDDERSEQSSRSERSHSDDLSFLGDDHDLTVKTTVNDPSLGIKLTIAKRPKTKSESSQGPTPKRRKKKKVPTATLR